MKVVDKQGFVDDCARDHGYPLRVVVPGVIGARSVKWLEEINIIAEECQGFFMQKDYKMFPPSVNWDNIDWSTRRPQMDFPVQCVICSLEDVSTMKPGKVKISGYAAAGGGRGIERVDVSIDGGKTWMEASRFQKSGVPYISEHASSDKWAWVFFEVTVDICHSTEIIAKATQLSELEGMEDWALEVSHLVDDENVVINYTPERLVEVEKLEVD
ncbi:hypothetical protein LR48_Vigan10g215500 [Vigna angularis]|uniref:Sulfite oxidase n=1 Tax=Phaseolus angularis TaxID=3914 RepID=A0A0L9VMS7_PHAAN|nr:hypothetical protein LR48_Vigan10g215500 [Vigna angularis]